MLLPYPLYVASICLFLASPFRDMGNDKTETKLKTLYQSLEPSSISQHLAYYELYPHSAWGQQALTDAWNLLSSEHLSISSSASPLPLSASTLKALMGLVNPTTTQELPLLDESVLKIMTHFSKRLAHVHLKGHAVWSEEQVLQLPLEEIDLARSVFIMQFGEDSQRILTYEAYLDLMALQILARLPSAATAEEKIHAINTLIFDEMGFRFPPHTLCYSDIDAYSFLSSVINSRRGVCLGVSILYLCLAQRLALPLEMITPPGHIYVRYRDQNRILNIETTARGIHLDCDHYLSIQTRALEERTMKEVIGMAHVNQASVFWKKSQYPQVLAAYQKAYPYLKDDITLKELMGFALILNGHKEEGEAWLKEVKDLVPPYAITKNTLIEDYFLGNIDIKGISILFDETEEDRPSLLERKKRLEQLLRQFPTFRAGILQLAMTWLKLHRSGEALCVLEDYFKLDEKDPEVQYYLAMLYHTRQNYPKAWSHLQKAERIVKQHNHSPKALKELRRELLFCIAE